MCPSDAAFVRAVLDASVSAPAVAGGALVAVVGAPAEVVDRDRVRWLAAEAFVRADAHFPACWWAVVVASFFWCGLALPFRPVLVGACVIRRHAARVERADVGVVAVRVLDARDALCAASPRACACASSYLRGVVAARFRASRRAFDSGDAHASAPRQAAGAADALSVGRTALAVCQAAVALAVC